ncbi:MAG: SufE family protein [Geminicoccaceae bacterium]
MEQSPELAEAEKEIVEEFELFDEPRETIEHIVELGRELPPMADALKNETTRVRGCQSQVWLAADLDATSGRMQLAADSDAVIVKGLVVLVLRLFDNRKPGDVAEWETDVFERIGLGRMLTPGRQNGLYAMLARIRQLAAALAATRDRP